MTTCNDHQDAVTPSNSEHCTTDASTRQCPDRRLMKHSRPCEKCGNEFRTRRKAQRFCSRQCAADARRIHPKWEYWPEPTEEQERNLDEAAEEFYRRFGPILPKRRRPYYSKFYGPRLRKHGLPGNVWEAAKILGMSTTTLRSRLLLDPDNMPKARTYRWRRVLTEETQPNAESERSRSTSTTTAGPSSNKENT